jgi:hypothetical protein
MEVNMNISKFTLDTPDSDGDMSAQVDFVVVNATTKDIRHIRYGGVFENKDGVAISGDCNNSDDCMIEPGEEGGYSVSTNINTVYTDGAQDQTKAKIFARLFEREFFKLGNSQVPKDANSCLVLNKTIDTQAINKNIAVSIFRSKPDDDGDITITNKLAIENRTQETLYNVTLKAKLLDSEGSEIDVSESSEDIPAGVIWYIETGFWGIKKSKLKDAEIAFQLSIYKQVAVETCEAVSSPSSD